MKSLTFDVYGQKVLITATADRWVACYLGAEGKSRPAHDIVIPRNIAEAQVEQYLSDLCHERATARYPTVRRLK